MTRIPCHGVRCGFDGGQRPQPGRARGRRRCGQVEQQDAGVGSGAAELLPQRLVGGVAGAGQREAALQPAADRRGQHRSPDRDQHPGDEHPVAGGVGPRRRQRSYSDSRDERRAGEMPTLGTATACGHRPSEPTRARSCERDMDGCPAIGRMIVRRSDAGICCDPTVEGVRAETLRRDVSPWVDLGLGVLSAAGPDRRERCAPHDGHEVLLGRAGCWPSAGRRSPAQTVVPLLALVGDAGPAAGRAADHAQHPHGAGCRDAQRGDRCLPRAAGRLVLVGCALVPVVAWPGGSPAATGWAGVLQLPRTGAGCGRRR